MKLSSGHTIWPDCLGKKRLYSSIKIFFLVPCCYPVEVNTGGIFEYRGSFDNYGRGTVDIMEGICHIKWHLAFCHRFIILLLALKEGNNTDSGLAIPTEVQCGKWDRYQ